MNHPSPKKPSEEIFRFLSLPLEIQRMILELVHNQPDGRLQPLYQCSFDTDSTEDWNFGCYELHPIAGTCKAIHTQSLVLAYNAVEWIFVIKHRQIRDPNVEHVMKIQSWCRIELLRTMEIRVVFDPAAPEDLEIVLEEMGWGDNLKQLHINFHGGKGWQDCFDTDGEDHESEDDESDELYDKRAFQRRRWPIIRLLAENRREARYLRSVAIAARSVIADRVAVICSRIRVWCRVEFSFTHLEEIVDEEVIEKLRGPQDLRYASFRAAERKRNLLFTSQKCEDG